MGAAMEKLVTGRDLARLRQTGIITKNEIAVIVGDMLVAENVITKARRVLEAQGTILESNRRILRD
jgi:hypothetical protein